MLNSMFPRRSFSGRSGSKPFVATAFLVALLSLCFVPGSAFGQDQAPAPPSGQQSEPGMGHHMGHGQMMPSVDDQIKHLSKKLSLSDDQQAKLKPILEDQRKQMEAIHNDASLSREDRFSKMQELRQNSDTQIKSVLNEDQQKNFDKMREEQHGRMGKWRKGGDNAPPSSAPPSGGAPNSQQ
jgi:Spy/CpxP family protein refolding chaperone